MNTFTVANDQSLTALIGRARKRLVYIAPGVTPAVVDALRSLLEQPNPPNVTLIIDTDPEVCRLGYGTRDGLEALGKLIDQHHVPMRAQKGLRVGVLAADDELLVFSPIAQLVEANPESNSTPNAIRIGSEPLAQVLDAAAVDGAPGGQLPSEGEVGAQPASPADVERALKDLELNPPKAFDLARIERVFSSRLVYVDLDVEGYRLSAQVAKLPSYFLVDASESLKARVRATLNLFEGDDIQVNIPRVTLPKPGEANPQVDETVVETISEGIVEQSVKLLREKYLHVLPNIGVLMWRRHQSAFEAEVSVLRKKLELFKERLAEGLQARVAAAAWQVGREILAVSGNRVPDRLRKMLPTDKPSDEEMLGVVAADLEKAFGKKQQQVTPKVVLRFKDVTYQTLGDEEFRKAIEAHFGPSSFGKIFSEYDAARENAAARTPDPR
jgi:hypothetical protein